MRRDLRQHGIIAFAGVGNRRINGDAVSSGSISTVHGLVAGSADTESMRAETNAPLDLSSFLLKAAASFLARS